MVGLAAFSELATNPFVRQSFRPSAGRRAGRLFARHVLNRLIVLQRTVSQVTLVAAVTD